MRRQAELSQQYADEHGLTLDVALHLRDLGLSAFDRSNLERGALGAFVEAITRGHIAPGSFLLIESLDRLSRAQVLDAFELFTAIIKRGITIVTLTDNMVYSQESLSANVGNLIVSITIMARAHEESALKSRRLKAAWENKRANIGEKKLTARCPYWMRLRDDKKEFEFIPERVEIVRSILHASRSGMGTGVIAKRLNEQGTPTFSKKDNGWHSSYIEKITTSPALYGSLQLHLWQNGKIVPHGEPLANYYPALISRDEFLLLQEARKGRRLGSGSRARKGTNVPNLLSGIVKCGYCGSTMILLGRSPRKLASGIVRVEKHLVCDGARRGRGCYAVQWEYKAFEHSFLMFCRGLELERLVREAEPTHVGQQEQFSITEQLEITQTLIIETQRRLERLADALSDEEDQSATPSRTVMHLIRNLEHKLDELEEQKEVLEQSLAVAQASAQLRSTQLDSIREMIDRLEQLEGDERFVARSALASHIHALIAQINVYPAGRIFSPAEVANVRSGLLAENFDPARIESYIQEHCPTEPKRQGRGIRGRYGPLAEMGRFFVIKAKLDRMRIVFPDYADPTRLIVDTDHPSTTSNPGLV